MRSMYVYLVRNVFVKYREVWEILRLNIVNIWGYSYYWSGFLCYVIRYVAFKEKSFCKRDGEGDGDVFMGSNMNEVSEYWGWESKNMMGSGVV